jgi:hypothetical protein
MLDQQGGVLRVLHDQHSEFSAHDAGPIPRFPGSREESFPMILMGELPCGTITGLLGDRPRVHA